MSDCYAMKACPGLRSGIDRSGSLSFAIRGIPSPIRPPIRHSGEGRNPEGWGGVRPPDDGKNSPVAPFSYLGVPAPAGMSDWYENEVMQRSSVTLLQTLPPLSSLRPLPLQRRLESGIKGVADITACDRPQVGIDPASGRLHGRHPVPVPPLMLRNLIPLCEDEPVRSVHPGAPFDAFIYS